MADIYKPAINYIDTGVQPSGQSVGGQGNEVDEYINSLPQEEREAAIKRLTAPPSAKEIAESALASGRPPSLDEFRAIREYNKTKEVPIIEAIGNGFSGVMTDLGNAMGSAWNDPVNALKTAPANVIEGFAQGTRNFYGMLAQSADPTSKLFRLKSVIGGSDSDAEQYRQYMDAWNFNKHSEDLVSGRTTVIMDKDVVDPHIVQAMSYVLDPTLFIPFGEVASGGIKAIGMGEKLTALAARAEAIKAGVIGGTLKWGVGAPIEFMGGAVRNTIDYGLEKAGAAFEGATGMTTREFQQTARASGIGFSASGIAGHSIPFATGVSDAYIIGSTARGFGEAISAIGDTMINAKYGRGINSFAREALEQTEKQGIQLSGHAKGLLKALDTIDPLFSYANDITKGAAHGALIGGGLGYLSGGEEGMAHGIGAGIGLGAVGAGAGRVVADATGATQVARRAVQAKMVIEGHKERGNMTKAMSFEAMQKATEAAKGDVDFVNGVIAGIDKVAPNFEFHAMTPKEFIAKAEKMGYDPRTGKFREFSNSGFEAFGDNRASRGKTQAFLRLIGSDYVGNKDALVALSKDTKFKNSKLARIKDSFNRLSQFEKDFVLEELGRQKEAIDGGQIKPYELRGHYESLAWAESWTDQITKKYASDSAGAMTDIKDMIAQETVKGKLTRKGEVLVDKLRAEGFLDKEGKPLRERNLHNADLNALDFARNKGAVVSREADGKTHMYINLKSFGNETFPHELFHTIFRESALKHQFLDGWVKRLLGVRDEQGNLVKKGEVSMGEVRKFFERYIRATSRNEDGTVNLQAVKDKLDPLDAAIKEYETLGDTKKLSDRTQATLLEHYAEEFGAYYFSHWLMGKNRNTLFYGGELRGIAGLMDSVKDSFLDFWQSKISKQDPTFDFSRGLNEGFNRNSGLGRVKAMDYWMRDMIRAEANSNRGAFRVESMSPENRREFLNSNGMRNITPNDGTRVLTEAQAKAQNKKAGIEAFKILDGLDPKLRTSKTVLDENGKPVITGRLSVDELNELVKAGIVPRAWADKLNQGYAMLDGQIPNVVSFGYLGATAQTTHASYPRLTGKDVPFKNRKAIVFDIETKIGSDGRFYTLFHTLDKAVIEVRSNNQWRNADVQAMWGGDRAAFEADFFRYLSNASKAGTDPTKLDTAILLDKGDGLGAQRRNVMHDVAGIAQLKGDSYRNEPIARIPEGILHAVTSFNVDRMTTMRVENERFDYNDNNANRFIRENWQPDDMKQEKTPSGVLMTHASGFKFSNINGKTSAYTSAGRKIGSFDSIKQATEAAKREYHKVYDNIDNAVRDSVIEQDKIATKFQPLDENERAEAIRIGDVFALQSMKDFVGNRTLLRQTREEHIYQRALEAVENPEQLLAYAQKVAEDHLKINAEYDRLIADITKKDNEFEGEKNIWSQSYYKKLNELRDVKYGYPSSFEDWKFDQTNQGKWNPPEHTLLIDSPTYVRNPEYDKYVKDSFARYEADAKAAWTKLTADPEYIESQKDYNQKTAYFAQRAKELIAERDLIDEFKKKNKEALESPIVQKLTGVLDNYKPEDKPTIFAKLVEASAKMKDYSGLLEALFAREYDDQIQTGKPFVAVTTHGTGNVELMLARLFAADKLGSHYNLPSSRMGSFSAGSQNTSRAYARKPSTTDVSPVARFKRLTSLLDEKGMTDKTTEQYKAVHNFIDLYKQYLVSKKYEPNLIETFYKAFLHIVDADAVELELSTTPKEVRNAWEKVVKLDNQFSHKNLPKKEMQLRKVIRMDNPYVVVDPRSYEEHFISPHMKRAMEAGHDGIIFKRFADGGQRDNVYVVFKDYMKDNIKVIDTSFDDVQVPRGNDETGRVLKGGKELSLAFQPTEEDAHQGGRTYDFNSPKFKSSFIGKYAEENPERLQNKNIEFVKRRDGSYRITMTDNSGATKKIGHITADLDMRVKGEGIAEISSNIDPKFRGNKLANILYSEMAERLRAMGVKYVDGTIVNKDGIPVQVRNSVIGQTYYKGSNKPAFREDAAKQIQAVQSVYPSKGVSVWNELDFKARYEPSEEIVQKAKKAGYNTTVYYHGTPNKFTEFKTDVARTMTGREGSTAGYFFFTPYADEAKGIHGSSAESGTNVMEVFLKYKKPFNTGMGDSPRFSEADKVKIKEFFREKANYAGDRDYLMDVLDGYLKRRELGTAFKYLSRQNRAELLKSLGFDSLIDKGNHIVVFDPEQIKSAADFTYDDQGKQIPLSKRFDKTKKDIRYQPTEGEQGGRTYTDEQFENNFIGRIAEENPRLIKGLTIEVSRRPPYFSKENKVGKGNDNIFIHIKKGNESIGTFTARQFGKTEATAIESNISKKFQGQGYGKLIYSEMAERLRAMGVQDWHGRVEDQLERPIAIRREIVDKQNARAGKIGWTDVESSIDEDGFKSSEVTSKLRKEARYQPAEGEQGGRTYKDFQLGGRFIGKYAQENPNITKGLEIEYYSNDTSNFKDVDGTKWRVVLRDENGIDIGDISFEYEQNKGFFNGTEEVDGLVVRDISVHIGDPANRGKNYQHLLYSEMFERARAMGAIGFSQNIENKIGIPLKSINRIVGKESSKIWTLRDYEPVSTTQENFDRLMSNAPKMRSGKGLHSEFVQNNGKLDPNAWYQPAEGDDYRGTHKAPSGENGEGSLDAMDRTYPEDLYSAQGARFYGSGDKTDKKMHELILKFRGKPDAMVTVYRAVPKGVDASITKGDWVTPLREYAVLHGNRWEQGMTILEKKVKASELFTEGNSLYEFGWNPKELSKAERLQAEIDSDKKWLERVRKQNPVFSTKPNTKASRHIDNIERRIRSNERSLENINKPKLQPSEYTEFKSEQSPTGRILRNAKGYVIMLANNKFRVYNPAKAIIGVYGSEDEAKKRIYKEIPKQ